MAKFEIVDGMKECSGCGQWRPLDKYSPDRKHYASKCRDCVAERNARYRTANREEINAKKAAYYAENREKLRAIEKDRYARNAEKIRADVARRYAANPKQSQAYRAKWRAKNPDAANVYHQNRRARKIQNGGSLSRDLASRLLHAQKNKCACCRAQFRGRSFELDHIVPLALGGPNSDENIQLLCVACNRSKASKHPVEFMQSRGFLI